MFLQSCQQDLGKGILETVILWFSLIYQVTALVSGGVTIVISPLIALIEDQVANLSKYIAKCIIYT